MKLKYWKKRIEAQVVSGIPVKHKRGAALLVFVFLIIASCNKTISPNVETKEKAVYNRTLYDLTYVEAIKQKMLGNYGDAIKFLEQSLVLNPQSDAACFQLSRISGIRRDRVNEKKYALKAVRLDDKNCWYKMNLANMYINEGKFDSAAYHYEKVVELEPDREGIKFQLGSILLETGDSKRAERIFSQLYENYGGSEQILFALLRAKSEQGKNDEAEGILMEAIKSDPDNVGLRGMMAELYRKMGKKKEARTIYSDLLNRDFENSLLQLSYVDFLIEIKDYKTLFESADILISQEILTKEEKIGLVIKIVQDKTIPLDYMNESLRLTENLEKQYCDDPSVLLLLSEVYLSMGEEDKRITKLLSYINRNPNQYFVWESLLLAINDKGDIDLLYKYSKEAATKFNTMPLAKMLYALAAIERKEYELAEKELGKVRILVNEKKDFLIQILSLEAEIAYRRGDIDEAIEKFDEALLLDHDNVLILNNYSYYLAESGQSLNEARRMIEKCLESERNVTYMDTYAWVLYKEGKYEKANKIMNEIFETGKIRDSDIFEHYGYIKYAVGEYKKAVSFWQAAIRISGEKDYLIKEIEKCIGKE